MAKKRHKRIIRKMNKPWRPLCKDGMVSIRREGKFFAVVCRTYHEADIVEKALIRALVKARK